MEEELELDKTDEEETVDFEEIVDDEDDLF